MGIGRIIEAVVPIEAGSSAGQLPYWDGAKYTPSSTMTWSEAGGLVIDSLTLNGTTITSSGVITLTGSTYSLEFDDSTSYLAPTTTGVIDLGGDTERFKDLYLSGDIECDEITITNPTQNYKITGRSDRLVIQGQTEDNLSIIELYAKTGDGGDSVLWQVFGVGTPDDLSNRKVLQMGWGSADQSFVFKSDAASTAAALRFETKGNDDQVKLNTDGSVDISTGDLDVVNDGIMTNSSLRIDNSGYIYPCSSTNSAAPNNSIFYSTDNTNLAYKDSGGTTHDLH
jgi:hypothetical protein